MLKYKIINFDEKKRGQIYLDFINYKDINLIRVWRNKQTSILRQSNIIKKRNQINYFRTRVEEELKNKKPNLILLAIKNNKDTIGYCGFVNISWNDKRAEISFLLNHKFKYHSKEYESIMIIVFKKLFKLGFGNLKLKKIFTETFIKRKKHINIIKKLGMLQEGLLKKQYFKSGKYIDSVIHAKFKEI